jgi:hypothetical protein
MGRLIPAFEKTKSCLPSIPILETGPVPNGKNDPCLLAHLYGNPVTHSGEITR